MRLLSHHNRLISYQLRLMSHQLSFMSQQSGFLNLKPRLISLAAKLEIKILRQLCHVSIIIIVNGVDYYDPDFQRSLWKPKEDFVGFYNKKYKIIIKNNNNDNNNNINDKKPFRRKLSYNQVSDILENYSIPSVDCMYVFNSPSLDSSKESKVSFGFLSGQKESLINWQVEGSNSPL